ncbi:MAG: hypothetical protein LKJ25_07095 [Clostridia bacterium]|jgi:hypothetical protein|nr:hypothetical protein [Clostridia bacterium]
MWKFVKVAGIIGFLICLYIMYMTNLGVRGIREYAPSFQLPDMKFHYSVGQIIQTFEEIGGAGRAIYQKYMFLDFVFTLCFVIVMLTITNLLFAGTIIRNFMYVVCVFRAVFDTLENIFLLTALRNYPKTNVPIITLCSYFTSFKFVSLYIWIFALIIQIALLGLIEIKGL